MPAAKTPSVAIIGAGPRGISVLEQLLRRLSEADAEGKAPGGRAAESQAAHAMHIHLIDPFPPGPGRVWQPSQSELYLMNTPTYFPTAVPDACGFGGTTSFAQWATAEGLGLAPTDYPTRATYGRYLAHTYRQLIAALPDGVEVHWHQGLAEAVRPLAHGGGFSVQLSTGQGVGAGRGADEQETGQSLKVGAVVLALGHVPATLSEEQRRFQKSAQEFGWDYYPPSVPLDVNWSAVPAQEPVLIRGLGLNFFDVLSQLTVGRGGTFTRATNDDAAPALVYVPSGREPLIYATSRRGLPYRAKQEIPDYYPHAAHTRWLQRALAEHSGPYSFQTELWPAVERDMILANYGAALADGGDFSAEARAAWSHVEEAFGYDDDFVGSLAEFEALLPEDMRFSIPALAWPLEGRHFVSREEATAAVVEFLDADYAAALRGEADPAKLAVGVLNRARAVLKGLVTDGLLTEDSWPRPMRSALEPLVESLASGPPAHRIAELAAIARAGVLKFIGPEPVFRVDAQGFSALSERVRQEPVRASTLIEAMVPANNLAKANSALLRQLLTEGLARPRWPEEPGKGSGLDVDPGSKTLLSAEGTATPGLYALGLQLSSWHWGTAIAAQVAAEYPSGVQSLQDARDIVADILG